MSIEVLRDLARAKVTFQLRALSAFIGSPPCASWSRPRKLWVAPTVRRFAAGDAEAPGAETAVD